MPDNQSKFATLCTLALFCKVPHLVAFVALHFILSVSLRAIFCDVALLVAAVACSCTLRLITLSGEMPVFAAVVAALARIVSSSVVPTLSIYTIRRFTTWALPGLVANSSTVVAGHLIIPSI